VIARHEAEEARLLAVEHIVGEIQKLLKGTLCQPLFERDQVDFLVLVAIDAREVSAKDPPRPPSDKLFELARDFIKSRTGAG